MSADDSGGGPGMREVAWRLFAAEFDDADYSYSEGDRERAPNYVVTPTGARVNRLFVVGVLTAVESVSDEVLRARVVDPTGAFVVYAGQYQPDPLAFLERIEPPAFVAVTGKARTFQPDDSDVVYTSIRPESVSEVDAEARDRWVVRTAEQTLHRVSAFANAVDRPERGADLESALSEAGVDDGLAGGIPKAIERYGTTTAYLAALRELSLDAVRVVAGDREEAEPLALAPDEGGDVPFELSYSVDLDGSTADATDPDAAGSSGDGEPVAEALSTDGAADDPDSTATGRVEADAGAADEVVETAGSADRSAEPSDETVDTPGSADPALSADETVDSAGSADPSEASDGMYELDDEERAELEAEYPTEFNSGSDIPDAGEADIETPTPAEGSSASGGGATAEPAATGDEPAGAGDEPGEPADADEGVEDAAPDPDEGAAVDEGPGDETVAVEDAGDDGVADERDGGAADAGDGGAADDAGADEVPDDLEDVVVGYMQDLDDGDGADREALVDAVTTDFAVDADAAEEAVQDALMSGRCFEPADGRIKPI